jgi:nucleoside-diphosphate-sugar epimerase
LATLVRIAREKGVAGYVGDGSNSWAAVHRLDAASMVASALEKAPAGSRVHAVAESGIPAKDIAMAIGRQLDVPVVSIAPEDAAAHFGWIAAFFGLDMQGSSERTQELLGWTPTRPGLLDDLVAGHYFRAADDSQVA